MRGTLLFLSRAGSVFGIIPAYAGNTVRNETKKCHIRDHPRVCGEHEIPDCMSSRKRGIIPAYAGNTEVISAIGLAA